jgi:carbonic anhydrase
LASGAVYAGGGTHWGYSGSEGPEHWGELSPEFIVCSTGKNQSPINLIGFIESDLKPIGIQYQVGGNEILNNGHTVQVNYVSGSKISVDGHEFELKQYHFHAPSENHINGTSYPMEAHLVHSDKGGNLAVIAVMFIEGNRNESLAQAWAHMPEKAGDKHSLFSNVAAEGILPSNRDYYRYNGSLTTPPCSEGVRWLVMKEPVTALKSQIKEFAHVMHHPNNRPVQAVNARAVLR